MNSITTARWKALRERASSPGLWVELVDPLVPGCFLGVDEDGRLHLMIAITEELDRMPQELEAVAVRVVETDGLYIDVHAKGHFEMIFTPMVNQIFRGVSVQGRKPADVLIETIEEFRGALKPLKPTLTLTEQIGLIGELWVLCNVLIPVLGARAPFLWSGPDSERHDFIGEAAHIEVKTTTRSEDRHEVSRMDQLRAPIGKRLLFASVQLERSEMGVMSLATVIDEIVAKIAGDGKAVDSLKLRLAKMNWHDELRQSSELKKFNIRDIQFFEVEGSFPRLPDDYVPPRGIIAIKYTIDLSSRSVLNRHEVHRLVGGM